MRVAKQLELEFKQWGGARERSGRKRKGTRARVVHSKRELERGHPAHVTLRIAGGLKNLRCRSEFEVVREALAWGADRFGLHVVEFAVLSNHIHLICEADDATALARGMQGLCVRIARALNRLWRRVGPVFSDRYHVHELTSPSEVRRALEYVLHNAAHHGHWLAGPDSRSSGAWFDGWKHDIGANLDGWASPFPRPVTWLLSVGWRRHGLIDPMPAPSFARGRRHV